MRASRCGAPDEACRITIMSGSIASRLRTVSISDSPLVTLDVAVAMLSVSALRRFSATSNEVRVRVLGSKNRFTTVRPRSGRHLLDRARADLLHRLGGVEDQHDLAGVHAVDARAGAASECASSTGAESDTTIGFVAVVVMPPPR